jgi:hypothetical protein
VTVEISEAELRRYGEQCERELAALSPEACLATAAMLRDVKPKLDRRRLIEIAEEMAQEFEAWAASRSSQA